MENFLIVIIFIGSIIYKLYSNYKEELEKTKNRNLQAKPIPVERENFEEIKQEYKRQEYQRREEYQRKVEPTRPTARFPKEKVSPKYSPDYSSSSEALPEEVRKMKASRKNAKPLAPILKVEPIRRQPVAFDLRQAVIQSIILDRPYK